MCLPALSIDTMAGQTAEELKAAGNAAYAAGDNAKALESYTAALQAADAAPIAHVLHSNASAAAARLGGEHAAAALDHARRCVELKPDWPKGYARVGAAAQLAHRPGEAEAALRRGLKACPAGPEAAILQAELDRLLLVRSGRSRLTAPTCERCCAAVLRLGRGGLASPPATPTAACPCPAGRRQPGAAARLPSGQPRPEHARLPGRLWRAHARGGGAGGAALRRLPGRVPGG